MANECPVCGEEYQFAALLDHAGLVDTHRVGVEWTCATPRSYYRYYHY